MYSSKEVLKCRSEFSFSAASQIGMSNWLTLDDFSDNSSSINVFNLAELPVEIRNFISKFTRPLLVVGFMVLFLFCWQIESAISGTSFESSFKKYKKSSRISESVAF